jgi:predicted amidohydrolase YtcJ
LSDLLVARCEVDGVPDLDVRVRGGTIAEIGPSLRAGRADVLPAHGGALLPGLHDHHVHLLAMAAALESVECGPPVVRDRKALAEVLRGAARAAAPGAWVRGIGYHESVAGDLDSDGLDALVADHPVRVQHRSGALWVLNRAALRAVGRPDDPTGRLYRRDRWLRAKVPPVALDLAAIGARLAAVGVSGVTDATPMLDDGALDVLLSASPAALPQRLVLLGAPLESPRGDRAGDRLAVGPWKLVLHEDGIDPEATVDAIVEAHTAGRAVAIHCVTRAEVVVAVDALARAGTVAGDRLEHASVLPDEFGTRLRELGVAVVTQPNFIAERGDAYLEDVEFEDLDALYRCGSLIGAGVRVAGGTDAPFGRADPWRAMRAAVTRRTERGLVIGAGEAVDAPAALDLFLSGPHDPGGVPRRVRVGAPADLCLLHRPLAPALASLDADLVAATIIGGDVVHRA